MTSITVYRVFANTKDLDSGLAYLLANYQQSANYAMAYADAMDRADTKHDKRYYYDDAERHLVRAEDALIKIKERVPSWEARITIDKHRKVVRP